MYWAVDFTASSLPKSNKQFIENKYGTFSASMPSSAYIFISPLKITVDNRVSDIPTTRKIRNSLDTLRLIVLHHNQCHQTFIEMKLQFFIGVVDTQLFECVHLEDFKSEKIKNDRYKNINVIENMKITRKCREFRSSTEPPQFLGSRSLFARSSRTNCRKEPE